MGCKSRTFHYFWTRNTLVWPFVGNRAYCGSLYRSENFSKEDLPEKWFDSLFIYMIVGIIVGARLGHCLFYEPEYYLSHPIEILKIWEGGLASHGGVVGIISLCGSIRAKLPNSVCFGLLTE